jgi:hypothetical protein
MVQTSLFEAKTTNAIAGWAIGQQLRRLEIVDTSAGSILYSFWRNDSTGAAISTFPVLGTDCDPQGDLLLDVVRSGIGTPADSAAASDTADTGLVGLFKRLLQKIPALGAASILSSTPVVLSNHLVVTGPAVQTSGNNILASDSNTATDVSAFRSGHLDVRSTATGGTWVVEESIDGNIWFGVVLLETTTANPAPFTGATAATNSNRAFKFNLTMPLFRVRIASTLTGGSAQARASFSQASYAHPIATFPAATASSIARLDENLGLLSAQYEEAPISLAPTAASSVQQFNGFANCNCSFTLSGLLSNETAVLTIEQRASSGAPYSQMQLATVVGTGPHTITFSDFPALELRLRLVSATNPATRLTGVYWRFGK